MKLESKIEKAICDYAKGLGIVAWKFTSPGAPGVPDRLFVGPTGKIGFLEIKAPDRVPDRHQMKIINDLTSRGVSAAWTDSIAAGKRFVDSLA